MLLADALQPCGKIVSGLNILKSFSNTLSNIIINPNGVASNKNLQREIADLIASTREVIDNVENHLEIIKNDLKTEDHITVTE